MSYITDHVFKQSPVAMMALVDYGILCDWHVGLTPDGIRVQKYDDGEVCAYTIFMAPQAYVTQNKNDSWKKRPAVMKFRTTRDMIMGMVANGVLPKHTSHVLDVDFLLGEDVATKANMKELSKGRVKTEYSDVSIGDALFLFKLTPLLHQKPDGDNLLKGFKDCILPEKRVYEKAGFSGVFENMDDSKVSIHRTKRLITTLPGSLIVYRPFLKE